MDKERQKEIAQTILQQLGANRFKVMTGAHTFLINGDGLSFKLPAKPGYTKEGINYVHIVLNGSDYYDIEFGRIRGTTYNVKQKMTDIEVENLREVFTETTGLETSLGTMGRVS